MAAYFDKDEGHWMFRRKVITKLGLVELWGRALLDADWSAQSCAEDSEGQLLDDIEAGVSITATGNYPGCRRLLGSMDLSGDYTYAPADEIEAWRLGWLPYGECPCDRLHRGLLKREHVRSLEVLHGKPCEQKSWSHEHPCPHFGPEFWARLIAANAPSIRSIRVTWSNGTVEDMHETDEAGGLAVWRSRHATAFVSEGASGDDSTDALVYEGPF